MQISLIVGTRNRARQLGRCLEAVLCIAFEHDWELIIVDNGSTDESAAVVREFERRAIFPVLYLFEPKPGLGNAHNAGVSAAHGEILAFTDDDCYPAPDFLTKVWCAFRDPSVGYITGRIMLYEPTDYPITINESTLSISYPARSFIEPGAVMGANMAFRSCVLREIGGFDPWFGPGAVFNAEDVDAAARASASGWIGRFCPEVVVRHHHRRRASDLPSLRKSYGVGTGAYEAKLLLGGAGFSVLVTMLYNIRLQYSGNPQGTLWSIFGATKYAGMALARTLRRWIGRRASVESGSRPTDLPL
jgi:glycosyltransferase involved in cell wall biosynthesis